MKEIQNLVVSSIKNKLDDVTSIIEFYNSKPKDEQKHISSTVSYIVSLYQDDLDSLSSSLKLLLDFEESHEHIRNSLNHANSKYLFEYDDYIEEINLELLSKTTGK